MRICYIRKLEMSKLEKEILSSLMKASLWCRGPQGCGVAVEVALNEVWAPGVSRSTTGNTVPKIGVENFELVLQSVTEFLEEWQASGGSDRYKWKVFQGWHEELHQGFHLQACSASKLMHSTLQLVGEDREWLRFEVSFLPSSKGKQEMLSQTLGGVASKRSPG